MLSDRGTCCFSCEFESSAELCVRSQLSINHKAKFEFGQIIQGAFIKMLFCREKCAEIIRMKLTKGSRVVVVLREILLLGQDVIDAVVLIEGAVDHRWGRVLNAGVHHRSHRVVQIASHLLYGFSVGRQLLGAAPHLARLSVALASILRRHLLLLNEVAAGLRTRDLLRLLGHLLLAARNFMVSNLRGRGILLIA